MKKYRILLPLGERTINAHGFYMTDGMLAFINEKDETIAIFKDWYQIETITECKDIK